MNRSPDQQTYQRGVGAALGGLLVQLLLTAAAALMGLWSDSPAVHAAAWHLLGGLPLWLILLLIYQQHRLECAEALEAQQIAAEDRSSALFDERQEELSLARRRLARLYRFGLPLVSLLLALYLLAMGALLLWRLSSSLAQAAKAAARAAAGLQEAGPSWTLANLQAVALGPKATPLGLAVFAAAAGFVAFVVARYVAGMTRLRQWQLLRGGASYLMGSVLLMALLLVAALAAYFGSPVPLAVLAPLVPAIMLALGLEGLLLLVLGAYRPRRPGELPRPAFDSRALGFLTSPESLAKIINETINYQFGFEVSRSWFYQLLGKSLTPLLLFALLVLIAMSSLVIVGPQDQAVITRFGRLVDHCGPGAHLKWPWPIGRAEFLPLHRIQQLAVGTAAEAHTHVRTDMPILWTNEHVHNEDFMVTGAEAFSRFLPPAAATQPVDPAVAASGGISLVAAQAVVQYVLDPQQIDSYISVAQEPLALLRALAERRLSQVLAQATIDQVIGPQRRDLELRLAQLIQDDVRRIGLGFRIIFVGFTSAHPPQDQDVAKTFHEQVRANQEKQTHIENAGRQATEILAQVAGSLDQARDLDAAILALEDLSRRYESLRSSGADAASLQSARQLLLQQQARVDALLASAGGDAAKTIGQALAYRWQRQLTELGKARLFQAQVAGYRQAPRYYLARLYLDALAEILPQTRRFVVPAELSTPRTVRLDLTEAGSALGAILSPPPGGR